MIKIFEIAIIVAGSIGAIVTVQAIRQHMQKTNAAIQVLVDAHNHIVDDVQTIVDESVEQNTYLEGTHEAFGKISERLDGLEALYVFSEDVEGYE